MNVVGIPVFTLYQEGEDNGRSSNIAQLLDNLDPQLRQKVIMGRGGEESESEEEEEDEEDAVDGLRESSGWGKKSNYWSGDTADLEIGQDVEDAEDEEEAAKVRSGTSSILSVSLLTTCCCSAGAQG